MASPAGLATLPVSLRPSPRSAGFKRHGDAYGLITWYGTRYTSMFSSGLQGALGLAFWLIAARLYSVGAIGRGSSLIAAVGVIASAALLGLNTAFVRYLPAAANRDVLLTSGSADRGRCGRRDGHSLCSAHTGCRAAAGIHRYDRSWLRALSCSPPHPQPICSQMLSS